MYRLLFVFLVMSTGFAFAQDQTQGQDTSDLSLGEPLGPRIGDTYVRDISGDWEIRCVKAPEGRKDPCHIYQLLKQANGNPIAEISIFALANPGEAVAGATIITPLETLLQKGLQISIDDGEPKIYPFSYCNAIGCHSRAGFTGPDLFSFERGKKATITIGALANPDAPVMIAMSLTGFTAAYDGLFD